MLVPPESSSAVVVMISSKSVSIGNHCRARLVDSSRNRTFPNISYAGCPGLSLMVSAQLNLKMCIAA